MDNKVWIFKEADDVIAALENSGYLKGVQRPLYNRINNLRSLLRQQIEGRQATDGVAKQIEAPNIKSAAQPIEETEMSVRTGYIFMNQNGNFVLKTIGGFGRDIFSTVQDIDQATLFSDAEVKALKLPPEGSSWVKVPAHVVRSVRLGNAPSTPVGEQGV